MSTEFLGFSRELPRFLSALGDNNEKPWFDAHRAESQELDLEPAKRFVGAVGEATRAWEPEVHAEARVNGSIMRVNRDTRFAADKRPYKDHLDMMFSVGGDGYDRTRPAYMMRLRADCLMLGGGLHGFSKEQLAIYRRAVVDGELGLRLEAVAKDLSGGDLLPIGGAHYKRVPRGFDAEHPRAPWLLHNGLHTGIRAALPAELFDERAVGHVLGVFAQVRPLVTWLETALSRG